MVSKRVISGVKQRLVKAYNPEAIYLFGSYAWGTPDKESDLDILVVISVSQEKSYKRAVAGHRALLDLDISKDIIVYTSSEFKKYVKDPSSLGHKIKKDGLLLYAKS